MSTNPMVAGVNASTHSPLVIERFLRNREDVWQQIEVERDLDTLIFKMLISSVGSLSGYGFVIGLAHSPFQALSSALKLPILFFLTLLICLPTFYLFNLIGGGRLSLHQVLSLVLSAITVTSALTLAFAPITLFFQISARSYEFFVLLNVLVLALTGGIGLRYLVAGTHFLNRTTGAVDEEQPARPRVNLPLLNGWLVLYMFVGTQLAWTLRPFFGYPGEPFMIFRHLESNFYAGVVELALSLVR